MIRPATIEDVPFLAQMASRFYGYAVSKNGLKFNPSHFMRYCILLVESDNGMILVMERDGKIVGSSAAELVPWFMDFSQVIMSEKWWWVDSDYRGGVESMKLVSRLIGWGKSMGASTVIMVAIETPQSGKVEQLYERMGFSKLETHYIKGI